MLPTIASIQPELTAGLHMIPSVPPAPPPSPVAESAVINIHNLPLPEVDQCVICLETLDTKPTYSLPECNHTFHQNCIMHWFRQGNCKCPLCNETGALYTQQDDRMAWYRDRDKYKVLRRFARRKSAPIPLKKYIARLRGQEKKLRELGTQSRAFKNREGQFGALHKEWKTLRRKQWTKKRKIRYMKNLLAIKWDIRPIILVEKQIIHQ